MFARNKFIFITGLTSLLMLLFTACTPVLTGVVTQSPDAIYTQAASTIAAQLTLEAAETIVAQQTLQALQPTSTPTATATLEPTATSTATQVPPTATNVPPTNTPPPPTITPVPCNRAQFVGDVTVPDGTTFEPLAYFTKTWRFRNVGACTWNTSYSLVFVSGSQMGGASEVGLTSQVKPGEVVDISVVLRAPEKTGKYEGFWQLRDNNRVLFGLGSDGSKSFWVKIEVIAKKQVVYSMVDNYCSATWSSNSGVLPCPGSNTSINTGYVLKVDQVVLENGVTDDESGLYVRPDESSTGFISGKYPALVIKTGDHFRSVIGCGSASMACDVTFEVLYSADGGAFQSLGTWREKNEGKFVKLDLDLSFLNGKSVSFVLRVLNNGNATDDTSSWLAPRIVR